MYWACLVGQLGIIHFIYIACIGHVNVVKLRYKYNKGNQCKYVFLLYYKKGKNTTMYISELIAQNLLNVKLFTRVRKNVVGRQGVTSINIQKYPNRYNLILNVYMTNDEHLI